MSADIIFVHGWGTGSAFWDRVRARLPEMQTVAIDLEFIGGGQSSCTAITRESSIYITHSLGTMWALKNHHRSVKGLIAINGFSCFQHFADERTLRAMKTRLQRTPEKQMQNFWKTSGLPPSDDLNVQRLKEGLAWLSSWDVKEELKDLTCPILSLAGAEDPILPLALMKEEWAGYDMRICEGEGHGLPLSHPDWCANHIKDFIHAL